VSERQDVRAAAEENKSRVLDLIERVMNGHDADALVEFTSNPAVLGSVRACCRRFAISRRRCGGSSPE
jgi:hypothetical protein